MAAIDMSDSRREMIEALEAFGPHAALGDQARLFDGFVGTWDVDCVLHQADGTSTRFPGEWIFGWVLDGRAVQDVLIGFQKSREPGQRGIGTSIRFYDAASNEWHVVWVAPSSGNVVMVRGGAEGDRIVLNGVEADGSTIRWSFNDIRPDEFLWRGETSADNGKTWRVEQEMHLKRRRAPASAQT